MTTLAKAKAQSHAQPPQPLAVTPNVRLLNSPVDGAALSISTEHTNIVQVVNPPPEFSLDLDGQNFSAFGANHFILHVDSTTATAITVNFVRGATVLDTTVIEVDADQLSVVTLAHIVKGNDQVSLLTVGQHTVGKSDATGDVSGYFTALINAQFDNNVLQYTAGTLSAIGSADAGYLAIKSFTDGDAIALGIPDLAGGQIQFLWLDSPTPSASSATMWTMGSDGLSTSIGDGLDSIGLNVNDVISINRNGQQLSASVNGQTISLTNPAISSDAYLHIINTNNLADAVALQFLPPVGG
ncbi:MAG: hypothetical protein VXW65_10590 [Pseudomonadota bacterium]|nr:hypothetical protein [Pseudomonadota bacterium]